MICHDKYEIVYEISEIVKNLNRDSELHQILMYLLALSAHSF